MAIYKPPFCHTAVDFFGPMEVGLSRNRTEKRYRALFTGLTTRAVYLDLAPSLSSEDLPCFCDLSRLTGHRKPCNPIMEPISSVMRRN